MSEKSRAAVLLVDDDELLLRALVRVLRPLRRPVLTAVDAERAGALANAQEIGVVVCEPRNLKLAAFLIEMRARQPTAERLILTGYPDLTSVLKAVNEANPFKILTKPWLDEELYASVRLAFEQYGINVKRDRLIDEYEHIRGKAERLHARHALRALVGQVHPDIGTDAVAQLPVGALVLKDGAPLAANPAALRFFADLGLPLPAVGEQMPPALAGVVEAALAAPRGRRHELRLPAGRIDYFTRDIAAGTLFAFAPLDEPERGSAGA